MDDIGVEGKTDVRNNGHRAKRDKASILTIALSAKYYSSYILVSAL